MKLIEKSGWLCLKDRRVLFARSRGKDAYYLPGGKPEQGESPFQALIREIKEELSVDIDTGSVAFFDNITTQAHGEESGVFVSLDIFQASYFGSVTAASEIAELRWISHSERSSIPLAPAALILLERLKEKNMTD